MNFDIDADRFVYPADQIRVSLLRGAWIGPKWAIQTGKSLSPFKRFATDRLSKSLRAREWGGEGGNSRPFSSAAIGPSFSQKGIDAASSKGRTEWREL